MRQLDLALGILADCERFAVTITANLAGEAPGLGLRFDHYSVRRRAHCCPSLATAPTGDAYLRGFIAAALEWIASLARDLQHADLVAPDALADAAPTCLAQLAASAEADAAQVEAALDLAITLLSQTIAANLVTSPNRALPLVLPPDAAAIAVTLDEDTQRGWSDGNLRLILSPGKGPQQTVLVAASPGSVQPYACETLPPEPPTGRPRFRLSWPADRRPKAIRLLQHGGWPSPQGQLRVLALDALGGTIADLNPVRTALDLMTWLGRLSCETRSASGRNNPVYCLGWQQLMTNDFASLRMTQRALGYENARFADLLAAVDAHNRHLPPALRRVVGRHGFAKPLDADGLDAVASQMTALDTALREAFGLTPFLAHASLMGCLERSGFFADEDRASLAVVVEAQGPEETMRFGEEAQDRLAPRFRVTKTAHGQGLVSLTCTLTEADKPVPIELHVFRRDRSGRVFGLGEGARELAFETDWFADLAQVKFHGQVFRAPARAKGFLADVTASRWSLQGLWYGGLSSVRPMVEACARRIRAETVQEEAGLRFVGLRDLALDPDTEVGLLAEGRPYTRPAADLVADLSGLDYRHDLAAPLRTPLSPVALVRAPPGTIVRGTVLLALPDGRLFLPKHARYDGASNFADAVVAARDPSLPSSHFFSGLGRDSVGDLTLAEMPVHDIEGEVFWASPDEWDNWGVWLVQTLPALVHAERSGFDGTLLCRAATAWQHRFIEAFAPRLARRLVVQETDRVYRAGGGVHAVAQDTRTMALSDFARAVYAEVVARALRAVPESGNEERLFVSRLSHSRRNPDYRALKNEPALIEALSAHGFRAVEPETLDVLSQIALFARAREVVGLGGAGMFNLAFSREGASVLDIESSTGWVASHANLFATSGLRFGVIFGSPDADEGPHARWSLPLDDAMPLVRGFFRLG